MQEQNQGVMRAGDISIEKLTIFSANNIVLEVADYLLEFNLFEDMYSPTMSGNMVLSDSRNLIFELPIVGEELLLVKFKTPGMEQTIEKMFRVYSVTDRTVARERNTQIYTMHFASVETFIDVNLPLFVGFEGNIVDVVGDIFENYIAFNRNVDTEGTKAEEIVYETPLRVITEPSNKVKFVSPGWTPLKCINWLASRSIPKSSNACNFLFWESNKSFYFGSVETIFDETYLNQTYIGTYGMDISNVRDNNYGPNIAKEYFIASEVTQVTNNDALKNYSSGFLANRLISLDVFNKKYALYDYDHTQSYKDYIHSDPKPVPGFATDANAIRNPAAKLMFYPIHPKLYDNFPDNVNEKSPQILGNRLSNLLELTNYKLNISVPGRSDVEVGSMMYFSYPKLGRPTDGDQYSNEDPFFSGYYLITAIHHRITQKEHRMVMEIVKDSLTSKKDK